MKRTKRKTKLSKLDHPERLMERVRQNVGFLNSTGGDDGSQMAAFLAIFHPEMLDKTRHEIVQDAKQNDHVRRTGYSRE